MQRIRFEYKGRTYEGYVLDRDSDPTASVWVIDAENPDRDYIVSPDAISPISSTTDRQERT